MQKQIYMIYVWITISWFTKLDLYLSVAFNSSYCNSHYKIVIENILMREFLHFDTNKCSLKS